MIYTIYFYSEFFSCTGAYDPEWSGYPKKSETSKHCAADWGNGHLQWTLSGHGACKGVYYSIFMHLRWKQISVLFVLHVLWWSGWILALDGPCNGHPVQLCCLCWTECYFKLLLHLTRLFEGISAMRTANQATMNFLPVVYKLLDLKKSLLT